MNAKQFERRLAEVERKLDALDIHFRLMFLDHLSKEEVLFVLDLLDEARAAGWNSISAERHSRAELLFEKGWKWAKSRSRPHARKLLPSFPPQPMAS